MWIQLLHSGGVGTPGGVVFGDGDLIGSELRLSGAVQRVDHVGSWRRQAAPAPPVGLFE